MNILHVVGARPNFMKASPVISALEKQNIFNQILVHTGQHYDKNMSGIFFDQLGLPKADINLEVGSGTHTQQTSQIMSRFESVVLDIKPDLVLVYGDVNSTVATSLVCTKLGISIGHVEAGLRSFDRDMPEEINRILTDQMSDILFTPSIDGDENLRREGIDMKKVHMVGNVMIDTLMRLRPKTLGLNYIKEFPFISYALVTIHRPSNVDDPNMLTMLINTLNEISHDIPIIFPIHPRTRKRFNDLKIKIINKKQFKFIDPVGYLQFLDLQQKAKVVITDSGGVQEETTVLGIPCLTVRENTERPVTVTTGTNILVGQDMVQLKEELNRILSGNDKRGKVPPQWDGNAGKRIATIVEKWLT